MTVEGLRRETFEEAGIAIEVGQCIDCYWFGAVGDRCHLGLTFVAQYIRGKLILSAEHTNLAWYGVESLPADAPDWVSDLVPRAASLRNRFS